MVKQNAKEEAHKTEIYEAAICFSRMWGVMETLEPLPNLSYKEVRDIVMTWAKEYVFSGQDDMVEFFNCKAVEIKNKYIPAKEE